MHAEPLSLADAVRYHMSTASNPMEIGVVLLLADAMSARELARFAAERLLHHPRFRQTVTEVRFPRRPRWRDAERFELSAHVATHDGAPLSRAELERCISRRLSQRLPRTRPLWSLELFPLAGGASALLFRVHHCVADGLSLVRLLCELADEPRPRSALPARLARPAALPGAQEALRRARALLASLLRAAAAPAELVEQLRDPSGQKRVAWSAPLDLPALSRVSAARGCHLTDLLLAAAGEALARGMTASGQPVPRRVHALVPTGAALGRRELGNHFASTFVELALDEPDVSRRVARVKDSAGALHDPAQARFARALIGLAGWLSPPVMRRALYRLSRRASLMLSNVPGPAQPLALCGHALRSMVVFAPPSLSVGVSFTVFGYAGELRLGVATDAAVRLAPAQLVADFERALGALCAETRGA